jgi:hypothetical protein
MTIIHSPNSRRTCQARSLLPPRQSWMIRWGRFCPSPPRTHQLLRLPSLSQRQLACVCCLVAMRFPAALEGLLALVFPLASCAALQECHGIRNGSVCSQGPRDDGAPNANGHGTRVRCIFRRSGIWRPPAATTIRVWVPHATLCARHTPALPWLWILVVVGCAQSQRSPWRHSCALESVFVLFFRARPLSFSQRQMLWSQTPYV